MLFQLHDDIRVLHQADTSWQCVEDLPSHAGAMLHISHSCDALRRRTMAASLSDSAAPRESHPHAMSAQNYGQSL